MRVLLAEDDQQLRDAVARGLRDHQMWMEKNRPTTVRDSPESKPIVNYSTI